MNQENQESLKGRERLGETSQKNTTNETKERKV